MGNNLIKEKEGIVFGALTYVDCMKVAERVVEEVQ
jgi:cephalosporin-C deacetylase-like acetyl esterase